MLLISIAVNAQQSKNDKIIPAWKIGFSLDFGKLANDTSSSKENQEQMMMMNLAKAFSESSDNTPPLVCYVSDNYIRVEQNGLGGGITIADKRDTVSYMMDTTEKTVIKFPAAMPNLHTQSDGDSLVIISSDNFKMELINDTTIIAGQLCKKALFINPEYPQSVITVWYASALPRLYWQKYSYLNTIPGCALSIGTISKGLNVGIKADNVKKIDVPEQFFLPPADYSLSEGTL